MADVFISYPRKDQWMMRALRAEIEKARITVWADEKLEPGNRTWMQTVAREVEAAHCVVVIITPNAKGSEWIEREVQYGRDHSKVVIPVLASGAAKDVPLYLNTDHRVDLREDFEAGLQRLLTYIRRVVPNKFRFDRVGSLYWLGAELKEILHDDSFVWGEEFTDIRPVVRRMLYHAERLELPDAMQTILRGLIKREYEEGDVDSVLSDLYNLLDEIGSLITAEDPDWQPLDPENFKD